MGKVFDHITEEIQAFINQQHLFFVASAPLNAEGHVNLSPKGMDTFRILGPTQVGYLDLTGSGNETSAHLAENGRLTFMFCAFEGPPNIVRLYGTGRTILPETPQWDTLIGQFMHYVGTRQLIIADIHRVSTACGFAVPFFDYQSERETLTKSWEVKGEAALAMYWQARNVTSIDGLATPLANRVNLDEQT